ncbi:dixin isoform X1 [Salmo trutta]|uniref:dixin isoform X1 n=1 Tax=Salmo trutta TaxID=8032 RepID=UPI00113263E2|nr:dixin-like isoform X1 [Salmo trutta]
MNPSLCKGIRLDDVHQDGFNEQQLSTYVLWVNSQLKRRPGLKPITNLRVDLQDGVVLSQLVEIVAGEVLEGVNEAPRDREESRENVERVLNFITSRRIRMAHTSARDIVEGDLKSVMRLILALAAHFKPSANQRAASRGAGSMAGAAANHRTLSTVAMAQSAATALAAARHDAERTASGWGLLVEEDGGVCVRALVQQYERRPPDDPDTPSSSPRAPPTSQSDNREPEESQPERSTKAGWESPLTESLEREMQETRRMVSALQALLLHGSLPDDEQEKLNLTLGEDNTEQQLVVIRSHLDQSMEETRELKRELLRCKQEVRHLRGVKEAQQQRLFAQEECMLQLKQEQLRASMTQDQLSRASMTQDQLSSLNAELQRKLDERSRLLSECKKELGQKDRLLQQHKHKLEESQLQKAGLQRELECKDNMLQEMKSRHGDQAPPHLTATPLPSGAEELQLVRSALRSLRGVFGEQDPQHHTLDTLEQGITSLTDRLTHTHQGRGKSSGCNRATHNQQDSWPPSSKITHNQQDSWPPSSKITHNQQDSWPPSSKITHNQQDSWPPSIKITHNQQDSWPPSSKITHNQQDSWPPSKMAHSYSSPLLSSCGSTKVLYFTDHSQTPCMIHINKRLGKVTLRDVKTAVDRDDNHRFHFKALDPEFGTVKEEVFEDDALVPGWEGKIVAWVEEDNGEERTKGPSC